MNKDEKEILKKAIKSNEGLISPANMINSYAGGIRRLPERLVSLGYFEMVPEEISTGTVINFYRVTEKGFAVFYPLHKKVWYTLKGDVRITIVAVIISILTTLITLFIHSII